MPPARLGPRSPTQAAAAATRLADGQRFCKRGLGRPAPTGKIRIALRQGLMAGFLSKPKRAAEAGAGASGRGNCGLDRHRIDWVWVWEADSEGRPKATLAFGSL